MILSDDLRIILMLFKFLLEFIFIFEFLDKIGELLLGLNFLDDKLELFFLSFAFFIFALIGLRF